MRRIRIETPDGYLLQTAIRRLEEHLAEQLPGWEARRHEGGMSFEAWAGEFVADALRNLAEHIGVETDGERLEERDPDHDAVERRNEEIARDERSSR